jgi:ATP-dependent Clp protease ATP-binding subunit ClpC
VDVTKDLTGPDELDGFTTGARRALSLAEREARALGHDRVGTEHVLLGLLTEEDGAAAEVVLETGVSIAAVRRKVQEAVGPGQPGGSEPTSSARASRAIARAPRFARDAGATAVSSEHLLLAVLDVEGTAGQVLRGLGVDVEHLRAALGARPLVTGTSGTATAPEATAGEPPRCPSCGAPLDGGVQATVVTAFGHGEATDAVLLSCPVCGTVLGAR